MNRLEFNDQSNGRVYYEDSIWCVFSNLSLSTLFWGNKYNSALYHRDLFCICELNGEYNE